MLLRKPVLENGSSIIRARQVNCKKLKEEDFLNLPLGNFRDTFKTEFTRNYAQ